MSTSAEFGSLTCVAQLSKVHGNTIQSLSGGLLVMLMISAPAFLVGLVAGVFPHSTFESRLPSRWRCHVAEWSCDIMWQFWGASVVQHKPNIGPLPLLRYAMIGKMRPTAE